MSQSITRSRASVFPTRPSFQRTALASAIMMTMVTTGTQAKEWSRNVEVFGRTEFKDNRMLLGVQWLEPVWQDQTSMLYLDFRGVFDPGDSEEFNLGAGYRRMAFDRRWILGGYASFDTRNSIHDNRFNQIALGLEALSREWDLRANGYIPLTDDKTLGPASFGGRFQGTRLFAGRRTEEAMHGADFEIGRLLDFIPVGETRLYIGGYHFDGDIVTDSTGFGKKVRLEYRPQKHVALEVGAEDDNLFGTTSFVRVRFSFGYPAETGVRTLDERMVQFAERDVDIRTTGRLPEEKTTDTGPGNDLLITNNVVHIDNTHDDGGDGSFEDRYNDFAECAADRCANSNTLVYVHEGDGTATGYDQTFSMTNNQRLIGQGFSLYGIGGNAFPILTAGSGDGVVLAKNNEVAGLEINGADDKGIYGRNPGNFHIHHNRILNSSDEGINIVSEGSIDNGLITDNRIAYNEGVGLYLEAKPGSSTTQNVTIANNRFIGNYGEGIEADVHNYGESGTVTQNVTITGNTFRENSGGGILFDADAGDGGTVIQTATIDNNRIVYNEGVGIAANNDAYNNGTTTQTLNLNNNAISNNYGEGINAGNSAFDDGTATQTLNLDGNTIRGNFAGVKAYNEGGGYGNATQTLNLDSNTIRGNYVGVKAYNEGVGYGNATQTLNLDGNTISGNYVGVGAMNKAYSEGSTTQTLNLDGNTISGNEIGVKAYNEGANYGSATQTLNLDGNDISGNYVGVAAANKAYSEGSATQNVYLRNANLSNNANTAVFASNKYDDGGTATQFIDLSGANTSGSGDDVIIGENDDDQTIIGP